LPYAKVSENYCSIEDGGSLFRAEIKEGFASSQAFPKNKYCPACFQCISKLHN
jgi:hypothetical protein